MLRIKIFNFIIHFTGKTILKKGESRKKSGEAKVNSAESSRLWEREKQFVLKRKSKYFCEYYNDIVIKPSCFLYTNAALNAGL